jgi:carboxymethylenebutenolidase
MTMVNGFVSGALSLLLSTGTCYALALAGSDFDSGVEPMAAAHAHDTPVATPAAEALPRQPVAAEDNVSYGAAGGQSLHGYLAHPKDRAVSGLPGLIVIHEWWGLNDNIRAVTRRLAGEGYVALAVDLYGGAAASGPDQAKELMGKAMAHPELAIANLQQAYAHLLHGGANRIGVIGWCFGGAWSLQTAIAIPDLKAAVVYYGRPETDRKALAALQVPVLGLYGTADQSIPVASVRAFEALAKELGKKMEIHLYEGAGHAFANPSGTNYRAEAATDAWQRSIAFLDEHLKK